MATTWGRSPGMPHNKGACCILLWSLFETQDIWTQAVSHLPFVFLDTYPSQLQVMLQGLADHASVFQGNGRP